MVSVKTMYSQLACEDSVSQLTNDPAGMQSMISFLVTIPDSGIPFAKPLAIVMRSGTTPLCSMANILPVRPKPVWISSAIMRMPCWSHTSRIARR